MNLLDLKPLLPADTIFDLRYATANNIKGKVLYHDPVPMLEAAAANKLASAADFFKSESLRLVIWDAYRSPEVHSQLQEVTDDQRYVLDNSNHPKGLAIDLTLADLDGNYLDMGTDFDDFTEMAHVDAANLTKEQAANRKLLIRGMKAAGFEQWPFEWWHFDYGN